MASKKKETLPGLNEKYLDEKYKEQVAKSVNKSLASLAKLGITASSPGNISEDFKKNRDEGVPLCGGYPIYIPGEDNGN